MNYTKRLSFITAALANANAALKSWQSYCQIFDHEVPTLSRATHNLMRFIDICEQDKRMNEACVEKRRHRFDGVSVLQATFCAPDGRTKRIAVAKPRDAIEEPYITETLYASLRKALGDEIYTVESFPICVVSKIGKITTEIKAK